MPKTNPVKKTLRRLRATARATQLTILPVAKSPDEILGELFRVVQLNRIHPDGKTFVDLVPNARMRAIAKAYERESHEEEFDLKAFVEKHFKQYLQETGEYVTLDNELDPEAHIDQLWDTLTKRADKAVGSLIPLPNSYIVPGGRFQEQFYWDSYFVMLGLEASGRHDLTDGMMANYSHYFRKFGFIPTGNRTYFTSRSQPPFYAGMVKLVSRRKGTKYLTSRLPYLLQEDYFWNRGGRFGLKKSRRIKMPDGGYLNRYFDSQQTPRPESYSEDVEAAHLAHGRSAKQVYLDLRAGAESGWDFSSRWFKDPQRIETIRTTNLVPVDLNCLLYELELTIAQSYRKLLQIPLASLYEQKAAKRKKTITAHLWDEDAGYFFDYHLTTRSRSKSWTLAGAFPLYVGLATDEQATKVAAVIEEKFLQSGGVVTTLEPTDQQWDWPNGWAPLQWTTIIGLRKYGYHDLASAIKQRWLGTNEALFANERKFVEKYNVVDPTERGGGGEYTLQDGFGWTNGVFRALRADLDHELDKK